MTRLATRSPSRGSLPSGPLSYHEFLKWDGENQHLEWVDGEVIPMAAVTDEHSVVSGFLFNLLSFYVESNNLGEVHCDPFQMKTGPDLPGRAPDVLFIAKKHLKRRKKLYLDGPADLVIEVVSPGSRRVDRGPKLREYDQGGVREYWIIDPQRKEADFFRRSRDGAMTLAKPDDEGVFRSSVIKGFWIDVAWLWQRPRPSLRTAYAALELL